MTTTREVFYDVISQGVTSFFIMEREKICSFFGHRTIDCSKELYATTYAEIVASVDLGCRIFYFGGFGEFDQLCYEIVTQFCQEMPHLGLKRIYCVPLEKDLRKKQAYDNLYEDVIYLDRKFDGWYKSIYFRNLSMIDDSDVVIFYAENRENSGAYKAYEYARKTKNKRVVNIYNAL